MDQQRFLINLRQILATRLSEEELRTLCFDLGVDYENLGGGSKAAHARELVSYFERRNASLSCWRAAGALCQSSPGTDCWRGIAQRRLPSPPIHLNREAR